MNYERDVYFGWLNRRVIREVLLTAKTEYTRQLFMNLLEYASKYDCAFKILSGDTPVPSTKPEVRVP